MRDNEVKDKYGVDQVALIGKAVNVEADEGSLLVSAFVEQQSLMNLKGEEDLVLTVVASFPKRSLSPDFDLSHFEKVGARLYLVAEMPENCFRFEVVEGCKRLDGAFVVKKGGEPEFFNKFVPKIIDEHSGG